MAVPLACLLIAGCEGREAERRLAQFLGEEPPAAATPEFPAGDPVSETPESGRATELVTGPVETRPAPPELSGPELYPGVQPALQIAAEPVAIDEAGDVTLNFVDVDIREVAHAVLGEMLGLNYAIDPRVQGRATLQTARPIDGGAVIGVLEDALAMNGAALVEREGVYNVVPLDQAISTPEILRAGGPARFDRGFGMHVIPLSFTSAAALEEVILPFVPPGRVFRVDPLRNLAIFVGTGPEARDIEDLIATFDVDWMAGRSFGIFPVRYVGPEAIIGELETVFGQDAGGPLAGAVRFLPIDRLSAVLVITSQESYLREAQAWISRLDRGQEGDKRQLHVYYVQNGRAAELASVLGQVFGIAVSTTGAEEQSALAPGLTPASLGSAATDSIDMGGSSRSISQDGSDLAYSSGDAAAGSGIVSGSVLGGSGSGGGLRIVADARNNALVINATAAEFEAIDAALQKLDIVPLQVLIEATIAEVTLNDRLEYGVQWFFSAGNNTFTFSTSETGSVAPTFPGFAYVLGTNDVRVVLNALSQVTDVKVISSPQLLVLDNEVARLQVGDEVPIVSRTAISVEDPNAPVVNEVEYRDTGVILNIVPRVNAGGLVVLDILQEVSDVTETTSSGINSPTIQQRRIASTVAINSGETVALGGLIRDNNSNAVTGVPVLSDIPILGNLFKSTVDTLRRTELLVLLTPRVVRDRQDARAATDDLRRRLRALDPLPPKIQ